MPRHSPYALVRLNFRKDFSLLARFSFELYEFLLNITFRDFFCLQLKKFPFSSYTTYPPCGEIVFSLLRSWKDNNLINVLFCSFSTQIFLLFSCQ